MKISTENMKKAYMRVRNLHGKTCLPMDVELRHHNTVGNKISFMAERHYFFLDVKDLGIFLNKERRILIIKC